MLFYFRGKSTNHFVVILSAFHLPFPRNGCFQHRTRLRLRKDSSEPFTKARGRRSPYKLSFYCSRRRRRKVFYSFDRGSPSVLFDLKGRGRGRGRERDDLRQKEDRGVSAKERKKEKEGEREGMCYLLPHDFC